MRSPLFVSPVSQMAPAASSQKDETSARATHSGSKSRDREQAAGWDTPSLRQQQAVRSVQAASWIFTLRLRSKSGLINPLFSYTSSLALGITMSKVKMVSKGAGLAKAEESRTKQGRCTQEEHTPQGDASGKGEVGTHHPSWTKASGVVLLLLLE